MRLGNNIGRYVELFSAGIVAISVVAAIGFSGGAAAQSASPEASPASGGQDCTADLGIVRSAKVCVDIIHASPDAPAVDAYVDGTKVVTDLKYGTESGFLSLSAGSHRVQVVATGADPSKAVIDVPALELVAGKAYEVAAIGQLAGITALVSEVDVHAILPSEARLPRTRVRIVNAVPGAPPVDVSVIGGDIATRLASGAAFGIAGGYVEITAGAYRVMANLGGTSQQVFGLPVFMFEGDKVYTIYALIAPDGASAFPLAVVTSASRLPAPATPGATPAS